MKKVFILLVSSFSISLATKNSPIQKNGLRENLQFGIVQRIKGKKIPSEKAAYALAMVEVAEKPQVFRLVINLSDENIEKLLKVRKISNSQLGK